MEMGRVRPAVRDLPAYRPGKAAKQAEQEHGVTNAIKLASNENPYAPVPAVAAAVAEAAGGANRYADHRAGQLRAALAERVGVDATQVTVGCGSVGLLQQLCLAYLDPGDEAVYPWPSFEAYPICVKMMGATPVNPPLVDHGFDLGAVADAVTERTKLVLLATPNNPTGTAVSTAAIGELLATIPEDVIVLVDEAYREFADPGLGDPVADLVPRYGNVIVTRTFSKAYGLAGLRVGYAIADPAILSELDKILVPFAVNAAGQAGALAALEAIDEIRPKIDQILAERARVVGALGEAGWALPPAEANFVYLPLAERTDEIHLGLERQGVVTRPFSGEGIRVTIGTPEENDRFLRALSETAAATV